MEYITYRIIDPRDGVPVYVGQTEDFKKRKKQHIRRAKRSLPKTKTFDIKVYLVLLYSEGCDPEFEIVDIKPTEDESLESEESWVRKTVESGFPVLNRWKAHRSIVKERFTSNEFKQYFCARFPANKVINYAPSAPGAVNLRRL
ncbi:GIY-YIG nuclease family protein [Microbulbifer epialgicus]|uniref:GIY-YIG nuclease family protein n=1 Tax=Microbulbifer epialgicus TaxID=393907 RepID=A0ABV4P488_9GAMM